MSNSFPKNDVRPIQNHLIKSKDSQYLTPNFMLSIPDEIQFSFEDGSKRADGQDSDLDA